MNKDDDNQKRRVRRQQVGEDLAKDQDNPEARATPGSHAVTDVPRATLRNLPYSAAFTPAWNSQHNLVQLRRMNAYDELVEVIAAGPAAERLIRFRASDENQRHVSELLEREKTASLSVEETAELERYLQLSMSFAWPRPARSSKSRSRRPAGHVASPVPAAVRRLVMQRANGKCTKAR